MPSFKPFFLRSARKISVIFLVLTLLSVFPAWAERGDPLYDPIYFKNVFYPDPSAADHGATGTNTVKSIIDAIGADERATLVFQHNGAGNTTTYNFSTDETITANITVIIEPGAVLSDTGNVQLNIYGPFSAFPVQCFDWDGSSYIFFGYSHANPSRIDFVRPEWWGAAKDGTTNDSAAINKAIVSLQNSKGGGIVKLQTGVYHLESSVVIGKRGITLQGSGWSSNSTYTAGSEIRTPAALENGTWFWIDATGFPAIEIQEDNATVKDLAMAWLHADPTAAGDWSPTVYGAGISFNNAAAGISNCIIENVFMLNAYNGVIQEGASGNLEKLVIDGLWGQFFNRGIEIYASADVCYINNVHAWPYWSIHDEVYTVTQDNTIVLLLKRADWHKISNIFGYQVKNGIYFTRDATHGEPGKLQISDISFDGTKNAGIIFDSGILGGDCIVTINNYAHVGYLAGAVDAVSSTSNGMQIAGAGIDVQIDGMYCYLEGAYGLVLQGSSNKVQVDNIVVSGFNYGNGGSAAIGCDNTSTLRMLVGSQRIFENAQNGAANFNDAGSYIVKDGEGLGAWATIANETRSSSGNYSGTAANDGWIVAYIAFDSTDPPADQAALIAIQTPTGTTRCADQYNYSTTGVGNTAASVTSPVRKGDTYTVQFNGPGAGHGVLVRAYIIYASHWSHPYN